MKKNVLLKAIALLFVATFAQTLWAQEEDEVEGYYLVMAYTESDEVDYFALAASPVVGFNDGTISVTTNEDGGYTIADLPFDSLRKMTIYPHDEVEVNEEEEEEQGDEGTGDDDDTPDGITNIANRPDFAAGKAYITGLEPGTEVYLYTADGQLVNAVAASQDGNACVDFNALKSGVVYLLRTPANTYKIINK